MEENGSKIIKRNRLKSGGSFIYLTCDSCNKFNLKIIKPKNSNSFHISNKDGDIDNLVHENVNETMINRYGQELPILSITDCCPKDYFYSTQKKATSSSLRNNAIVTILANEVKGISGKRKIDDEVFEKVIKYTQNEQASSDIIKKVTAEVGHLKKIDHLNGYLNLEPFLEAMKSSNPGFSYRLSLKGNNSDSLHVFENLTFCMPYAKSIINGGYYCKVLGIDTAHLKDIILSKEPLRKKAVLVWSINYKINQL